ncbi:unannotated protein [freshwater metagenome]|uniref:Unannotated protein n=1 Tax=freshwater metagenome TaxID=449393 RepID=A0A6J6WSF1_9ZZZZ
MNIFSVNSVPNTCSVQATWLRWEESIAFFVSITEVTSTKNSGSKPFPMIVSITNTVGIGVSGNFVLTSGTLAGIRQSRAIEPASLWSG